jgi:putative ABC transport system permease protein
VLRLAWRDTRASRRRLLLFTLSIVVGIAALVAVGSFGRALEAAVAEQAKALLGADLGVSSRIRFTAEHEEFLRGLGGEQAREITFSSMVVFPGVAGTRLVQVRALEGGFPFYGQFDTAPTNAVADFREWGGALVEESLLVQFGVNPGDEVRVGGLTTRVAGALQKVPGESAAFATIAPRVYLRLEDLEATGLLRAASLARYKVYFRFPAGTDVEALVREHRPRFEALRLSFDTVEERKEDLGQAMRNLHHFLNLVGFVALLLGGVGIASAIHVHVKQKLPTVAVLRCLGCPGWQAFAVYVVQGVALGLAGALLGAVAGSAVQHALPAVVADFVPFAVTVPVSWPAIAEASLTGFLICVLFTLLPLAAVRRVPPLAVLRAAYEGAARPDACQLAVGAALALAVTAFAVAHTDRVRDGLAFAGGLAAAAGVLALVARAAVAAVRRLNVAALPFVARQGLASLHRPNNRTLLLVLSLGLGTFLLLTLHLLQATLLRELVSGRAAGRANAILFDIQPDQRDAVADLVRAQGLPVLDGAPIVTMRLKALRGRPVEELLADRAARAPGWALRREFRSTFAATLRDTETITAGTWTGSVAPGTEPVPVSVEAGLARELGVGLGDELTWDVQGVPLRTTVASLREVDWRRVQPNFFVLFPEGVLEEAPAFHVLVTRVETPEQSAALQRAVVRRFPNVSAIDITLVLRTLDTVLGRIAFVIRFMALFTVATGLVVLVAAIVSGRWQRVRESVLLRVLGASRRQVLRVLLVEYAALGVLAAATGVVLALGASWALAAFVFKVAFVPPAAPLLAAVGLVGLLTVVTGLLASRGITTHPPLAILRAEG